MNNSRIDGKVHVQCPSVGWNPSRISTIATTAITAIACPLAILLNGLVILGVIKKKQLRSVTCILLARLAAADLLIAAVTEPLFIAAGIFRLLDDYEAMCGLMVMCLFTLYLICTVIYHLTALAWEKYVAIKKAVKCKVIVTRGRVKMCAIASWVLTAISTIPSTLYFAGFIDKKQFIISKTCFFSVPMTICLVAITGFFITIYLETRRRRQISVIQLLSQSAMNAAIERRVAKTTFLLTVTLFMSLAPTFVLWFFTLLFPFPSKDVFQWAVTFNQFNSLANPILYFYRNRRFRNTVLEMLNMRKPAENQIRRDTLPRDINAMQPTRAKPNSCKPNVFMEKHETSNAPRPNTAPFDSCCHVITRDEKNSLHPTSGVSGASRIRAATIGDIGMQVDLATFSQKEQDLQRKEHRYVNKPVSLPTNKTVPTPQEYSA